MTAFERFDPFERRIGAALEDIAPTRRPAYLDEVLEQTARTPQPPGWTSLEWWRPGRATLDLGSLGSRPSIRTLALLLLILALVAGAVAMIGAPRRPVPLLAVAGVIEPAGNLVVEADLPWTLRLRDSTVLIAGGIGLQRFDPATEEFAQLADTPQQVRGWTEAASGDLLIVSVEEEQAEPPTGRSRIVVERLPAGVVPAADPVEIGRSDFFFLQSAVALADDRFVILGQDFGVEALVALVFDPEDGTFARHGTSSLVVNAEHASLLPDGRILVIDQPECGDAMNVVLYDPEAGTFSSLAELPCAALFSTTVLADGRVLVAGGGTTDLAGTRLLSDAAFLIDPSAGSSTSVGPLPEPRWMHAAALAADGRVLLAGGDVGSSDPAKTTLLFDPATATFAPGPDLIEARMNATAVTLADGRILIFGHTTLAPRGTGGPELEAEIFR